MPESRWHTIPAIALVVLVAAAASAQNSSDGASAPPSEPQVTYSEWFKPMPPRTVGGGHCWKDADCPRYYTCEGKLGRLDASGECPADYSCPDDPGQIQPGFCIYKTENCSRDADCPPIANCIRGADGNGVCLLPVPGQERMN